MTRITQINADFKSLIINNLKSALLLFISVNPRYPCHLRSFKTAPSLTDDFNHWCKKQIILVEDITNNHCLFIYLKSQFRQKLVQTNSFSD